MSDEIHGMTDPVERVARAIHPGAFQEDERLRHQYCSPLAVERVQDSAKETARAAIAAMPGEPVAWRWRFVGENDDHWTVRRTKPPEFVEPQMRVEIQPLYAAPAMPATDAVREAAQAVIDRWETPTWKDAPATAVYINALKAALSHPSQGGWQPIETAPKDGSHVILAVTGDGPGPGYVSEGYYESDSDRGWFSANTHWTDYHDGQLWPSHWQPLPAPPEVQP